VSKITKIGLSCFKS